jgi:hypothetical protein
MNLVRPNSSGVVIWQIPLLLLFVAAFLSLPALVYSLFNIVTGTAADGKIFTLFFGLFILWLFLEFVATRERIEIDLDAKTLKRSVRGVFKSREQVIDLSGIKAIVLENRRLPEYTRKRQYLYMDGSEDRYLLNSPSKSYIDHGKLGEILSAATNIPYREQDYDFYS